jgi:probable HAF family extracellular repeat protein
MRIQANVFFLAASLTASVAYAAAEYNVTQLPVPVGASQVHPVRINDHGQIALEAATGLVHRPFLLDKNGQLTDMFASFGNQNGDVYGMNNNGQAVGSTYDLNGLKPAQPFLWNNGKVTLLPTPNGAEGNALAINDAGDVVGVVDVGGSFRATLWKNGQYIDLGAPSVGTSVASGIDNRGRIIVDYSFDNGGTASEKSFLLENGTITDLGSLGRDFTKANTLNNNGQIVGVSDSATAIRQGFIWENGVMTELAKPSGAARAIAGAINDAGVMIGNSQDSAGDHHPLIWTHGAVEDLTTLIAPDSGWNLAVPVDINSAGEIVGWDYRYGQPAAFLLTPTDIANSTAPEPGTLLWLALGGCFLLRRHASHPQIQKRRSA